MTAQLRILSEGLDQKLETFVIFSFVLWPMSVFSRETGSSRRARVSLCF